MLVTLSAVFLLCLVLCFCHFISLLFFVLLFLELWINIMFMIMGGQLDGLFSHWQPAFANKLIDWLIFTVDNDKKRPLAVPNSTTRTPATDMLYNTINGQAHNNSTICCTTICCTTNLPHRWIERRRGSRATWNLYSIGKIYTASVLLYCRGLCACFSG